jgi:hypothetical protein
VRFIAYFINTTLRTFNSKFWSFGQPTNLANGGSATLPSQLQCNEGVMPTKADITANEADPALGEQYIYKYTSIIASWAIMIMMYSDTDIDVIMMEFWIQLNVQLEILDGLLPYCFW